MPTTPRTPPSRQARAHAAFQLWLVNVLLGTVVGSAWLFRLPEDLSAWTWVYVAVALFSSVAVLALLPGLLFVAVHYALRQRWRLAGLLQATCGAGFLGLLYSDTIVYRLLRYHFNGAVLNVALTRGSEDAVHLGWGVWSTVLVYLAVSITLQYQVWRVSLAFTLRRRREQRRLPLLLQPRVVVLAVLLPAVGLEKSLYAAADIQGDQEVLWAAKPLPIYPKVRLGRLLDPEGHRLPQLEILPEEAELSYPLADPVLPEDGPRPSFFLLVLDSWRRDMFTPELTPALHAFSEGARVFSDHLAGGNGTRFGLFTMLYGLHGSYWFKVLGAFQSPAMIDSLQAAGYDVRVFSAASQNFPEFLPTAWVGLPREHVVDEFLDKNGRRRSNISYIKDGFVADAVESWLQDRKERGDERPFFCFVLLDAPHQPYYNPGGPYQPTVDQLDYIELGRTTAGPALDTLIEKVVNTYKNSVLCADVTAGRLLASLEDAGELERTVVMVTGDHGEEFQENGYWGHTSNFSAEQVAVPFYLKGPGIEPGEETRPTSHLDISNSLLELCGADPAQRGDYSLGESLFDPPAERARVVAGWSDIGIWTASGIFDLPLDSSSEEIEVYDQRWRRLSDVQERCALEEPVLLRIADECVRFLAR